MKRSLFLPLSASLLLTPMVWAQSSTPSTASPAPPSSSSAPSAQAPAKARGPVAVAQQDPSRVVAVVNGRKITAEEALHLLQALPQNELQQFQRNGGGLQNALQQIFLMQHLSDLATQQHLDQQEPWKTQLAFQHSNMLAQAWVSQLSATTNPSAAEIKSYYDAHPDAFQMAKLSAIIINFTPAGTTAPPNTPGARSETDAKAKADGLVKQIRDGGNFAELAKTNSDDKNSAPKGGELREFSATNLPKEISDPVFKLKPGEITDPIREANAYYILKLDSMNKKTFEVAQNEIVTQLKSDQVRKTLDQQNQQFQVQVQDGDFFNLPGTTSATTPSLEHPAAPGQPKPSLKK